jgi:hypothetical protein
MEYIDFHSKSTRNLTRGPFFGDKTVIAWRYPRSNDEVLGKTELHVTHILRVASSSTVKKLRSMHARVH